MAVEIVDARDPSPQFIFFAGKGGVGKTTCAAAHAVAAAKRGARVLIVSTDPAHSLGDALQVRLSPRPTPIRGLSGRLHAVELDARRAFAGWLAAHRPALGDVLEHGTWLDRVDIEALLDLPVPGIDELIALVEIVRLSGASPPRPRMTAARRAHQSRHRRTSGRISPYDIVVVDTAPTGHALRLLKSPAASAALADVLESLETNHRAIRRQLARVNRSEASDRLVELIAAQSRAIEALITDSRRTSLEWVMLPEQLSVYESVDALAQLRAAGVPIANVIVNRVLPAGDRCPLCDRIRRDQHRVLAGIPKQLAWRAPLRIIEDQPTEPRGVSALASLGNELVDDASAEHVFNRAGGQAPVRIFGRARAGGPAPARGRARGLGRARAPDRAGVVSASGEVVADQASGLDLATDGATISPERIDALRGVRLLFVGGKGGVGKTTVAATLAVRVAEASPDRSVLLLSTDPAHSLGDVFAAPVGDRAVRVPGAPANLRAREIDAAALLGARRRELGAALDQISVAAGAPVESGAGGLVNLAPPGVDELLAMVEVADLIAADVNDDAALIVVDTAPTGHALRLLEMPHIAHEWIRALLRILLKYRSVVRPGPLAADLVQLSKSIRRLQQLLRDPTSAAFLVVTRASEVPRAETERLLQRLRRFRIAVPLIVVNALRAPTDTCRLCRSIAAMEHRQVAALRRLCMPRTRCAIILTPLVAPPPMGAARLARWGATWRRDRSRERGSKASSGTRHGDSGLDGTTR